ncbi:MAG: hypothetical protein PVJ51_04530 [Acidobacteriota bacterium]
MFEIDDSGIDVGALEKRVKAAIEAKRGIRFTDAELEELRNAKLEPRLRKEDLPRGWLEEMPAVRSKLPEVPPPPSVEVSYRPADDLYVTGSSGARGVFLGLLRRLFRPFYRATLNLDWVLNRMTGEMGELAGRVNDQGGWAGKQLSDMTAQIDRWRDRDLHLYHNLVNEITALRLQQTHMQDRINELIRKLDALKERERALESLTVKERSAPADAQH